MELRRLVVPFSLIIFVYFTNLASSHRIQETLPSEFVQKSKSEDKGIYGRKLGTAGGGGRGVGGGGMGGGGGRGGGGIGGGGGRAGGGSGRGNGNSGTPKRGGAGAAVIPVYAAAGANTNRQSHHSAAHSNLDKIHFSSMLMMTFVYPLILLFC